MSLASSRSLRKIPFAVLGALAGWLATVGVLVCPAQQAGTSVSAKAAEMGFRDYVHWPADLDPGQFFPVSKVRPGMRGTGKTVFEGTRIETFDFEVLGVEHNFMADSDLVWVRLETPRLKDLGVVAGMSGSPVYLDGRMLGAVAYGYGFSKVPIAGITPIEQMIRVLTITNNKPHPPESGAVATNWKEAQSVMERWQAQRSVVLQGDQARGLGLPGADQIPPEGITIEPLATPLLISSAHPFVVQLAQQYLSPFGFQVAASGGGLGGGISSRLPSKERVDEANRRIYPEKPQVADGAALGVTLMQGSLTLSGVGTITLVHGDRLVAFGHPMYNAGQVDVPMNTAVMFGIMPSIMRPFKLGEVYEEIGSVRQDRMPAIGGQLNYITPKMPMKVHLVSPDMGEDRTFTYEIVPDRAFAPRFAMIGWAEALYSIDRLDGPMTLESHLRVRLSGGRTLERKDFLSGESMPAMVVGYRLVDYIGNLLNNPFGTVKIERIDVEATVRQRLDLGVILDARLDREVYRPGENVKVRLWIQRWHNKLEEIQMPISLPADLEDGDYDLQLLDGSARETFEYRLQPQLRTVLSIEELIRAMQVAYPTNALYLVLTRETTGMALDGKPMPDLPGSVRSAMESTAPSFKTLPLTLQLVREVHRTFPYEVGGMQSFPVRVDHRVTP